MKEQLEAELSRLRAKLSPMEWEVDEQLKAMSAVQIKDAIEILEEAMTNEVPGITLLGYKVLLIDLHYQLLDRTMDALAVLDASREVRKELGERETQSRPGA